MLRPRAKVTIDSLQEVIGLCKKSIGTKMMNDLDLCLEVVSRSCQPLRHIRRWISWRPLEIDAWLLVPRTTNRKWPRLRGIEWSRDRWRHVTLHCSV